MNPSPIDIPRLMAYFISVLNVVKSISTVINSNRMINTSMFSNFFSISIYFMNASNPTVNTNISMIILIILDVYRIMLEYNSGWLIMISFPIIEIPINNNPRSAKITISVVSDMRSFSENISFIKDSRFVIRTIHLMRLFISLISKNIVMMTIIESVILGKYVMNSENIESKIDFNSPNADDILHTTSYYNSYTVYKIK